VKSLDKQGGFMQKEFNAARYILLTLILFSWLLPVFSHAGYSLSSSEFNTHFENVLINGQPEPWIVKGDYHKNVIESQHPFEGKQSLYLSTFESSSRSPQAFFSQSIYGDFPNKFVKITGFVKYLNHDKTGHFALHLSTFDGKEKGIELAGQNKYADLVLKSSEQWHPFTLSLPIDESAIYINIGGSLIGKGKVWLDKFNITLDNGKTVLSQSDGNVIDNEIKVL